MSSSVEPGGSVTSETPTTRVARFYDALLEPHPAARDAASRRASRLLAFIVLVFLGAVTTMLLAWFVKPGLVFSDIEADIASLLLLPLIGAYALARRGRYRAAAWVLILLETAAVLGLWYSTATGVDPLYDPSNPGAFVFLVIPIFMASTVMSRWATVAVGAGEVVLMLLVPVVDTHITFISMASGPLFFVVAMWLIILVFVISRELLEQDRTAALLAEIEERRQAQERLAHYRDQLEQTVRERAKSLELANAELALASESKSRFLANMSHEFRTPLNSIIGFTGIMLQGLAGPLSDEQSKQLGMVAASSHKLLTLVNQLLDLARIESGREVATIQTFALDELLAEVCDAVAPLAAEKGLAVLHDQDGHDPSVMIISDRQKLSQILLNLVGNAVKFTETGTVTLSSQRVGERVAISVTDTGVGIPAGDLGTIFEEYRRLVDATGAPVEGSGLGLALSRKLARLLGGDVSAVSRPGVGSIFTVTIPIRP